MSYQVLARKWRPRNFEQLVGQTHVARALVNALDADRLHHAFIFTGTRGVGKTTLARILAKCINCESGVSSKPCGGVQCVRRDRRGPVHRLARGGCGITFEGWTRHAI